VSLSYLTTQGKKALTFIKGARTELRKVTWPTRQETFQTTLVVFVMVVIMALILWALDSLFLWLVSLLTAGRG
jgi:preprotein translocase subunit SecE